MALAGYKWWDMSTDLRTAQESLHKATESLSQANTRADILESSLEALKRSQVVSEEVKVITTEKISNKEEVRNETRRQMDSPISDADDYRLLNDLCRQIRGETCPNP